MKEAIFEERCEEGGSGEDKEASKLLRIRPLRGGGRQTAHLAHVTLAA
jgi:hypothetical protein